MLIVRGCMATAQRICTRRGFDLLPFLPFVSQNGYIESMNSILKGLCKISFFDIDSRIFI